MHEYWLLRRCHRVDNLEVLVVFVALEAKSDNVLEALCQGSKSGSPFVHARCWVIVAHQDCNTSILLDSEKLLLKPVELVTWVRSVFLVKQVEVVLIARRRVDSDDLRACWHCLVVLRFEVHAVVAVLPELRHRLVVEPLCPVRLKVVDWVVRIWFREVLDVHRPSIVVTLDWDHCDVSAIKFCLDHLSGLDGVVCRLLQRISCSVVRRVVSRPE